MNAPLIIEFKHLTPDMQERLVTHYILFCIDDGFDESQHYELVQMVDNPKLRQAATRTLAQNWSMLVAE